MTDMMRILVGGMLQESNSFCTRAGTIDDFHNYYFKAGEELLHPGAVRNELNGFVETLASEGGAELEIVPTLYVQAVSTGPIRRPSLDELKAELERRIDAAGRCDAVLFALHGAWVVEDADDADGEILALLRRRVGEQVPIVLTLDSHANVTREMAGAVNAIVGYRTFPHVDYEPVGIRAARLLIAMLRGETKPVIAVRKLPMIVPAENHMTYRGPMAELWAEADAGERSGDSIVTSLFAVQPWLNVKQMGWTVVVVGTDEQRAAAEADRLAALAWSKRQQFDVELFTVEEVIRQADEAAAAGHRSGLCVISDSADSPGAGSPGDSNAVLRRLLALDAHNRYNILLSMVDAPAAIAALAAGVGSRVRLTVGHTRSPDMGQPLDIEGVVTYTSEQGAFYFGGGMVANLQANMGRCAVVSIGRLALLLMEHAVFTGDPAMFRAVGFEPAEADFVLVKSAAQFRAEYEKLTDRIYILDTPGASTANLASLKFDRIDRPVYPFDGTDIDSGSPAVVYRR